MRTSDAAITTPPGGVRKGRHEPSVRPGCARFAEIRDSSVISWPARAPHGAIGERRRCRRAGEKPDSNKALHVPIPESDRKRKRIKSTIQGSPERDPSADQRLRQELRHARGQHGGSCPSAALPVGRGRWRPPTPLDSAMLKLSRRGLGAPAIAELRTRASRSLCRRAFALSVTSGTGRRAARPFLGSSWAGRRSEPLPNALKGHIERRDDEDTDE